MEDNFQENRRMLNKIKNKEVDYEREFSHYGLVRFMEQNRKSLDGILKRV